ncbi:MAG TPA: hypothetical protein EYQ50_28215 [Verrucomicrobiales bacterium]|nr:hypothetical protein [Verrucomicrobiales bacterium]
MPDARDARRRWFGMLFLALAAAMLIWGQTMLKPVLDGVFFLLYWILCFIFTGSAVLTAIWDMRVIRGKAKEEQQELLRKTLKDFKKTDSESPDEENSRKSE